MFAIQLLLKLYFVYSMYSVYSVYSMSLTYFFKGKNLMLIFWK